MCWNLFLVAASALCYTSIDSIPGRSGSHGMCILFRVQSAVHFSNFRNLNEMGGNVAYSGTEVILEKIMVN
jgi:hypothetical protein